MEQPADAKVQPSWADIAKEIAKFYVEKAQPDANTFKATKERPVGPKQNSRVRNWMVAMRRNFRSEDKNKALAPFTITRDRMDEVRNVIVSITYVATAKKCYACLGDRFMDFWQRMEFALSKIFSPRPILQAVIVVRAQNYFNATKSRHNTSYRKKNPKH